VLEADEEVDVVGADPPPQPVITVTTTARPKKTLRNRMNISSRGSAGCAMGKRPKPWATAMRELVQTACPCFKSLVSQ